MVDNNYIKSIGNKFNKYVFFGYNSSLDILFAYDFKNDRHDFFKKD